MKNSGCRVIRISVVFLLSILAIGLTGAFVWQTPAALAADVESEVPVAVTGIEIDNENGEIPVGGTLLLTVTVFPGEADSPALAWTSSDESIAVVDQDGQVTAMSEGSADITVAAEGFSNVCTITVIPAPKVSLELKDEEVTLAENDALPLDISVISTDGESAPLNWTSSDPGVVSVDQNGIVTACGTGTAEITVSADGVSDVCTVNAVSSQIQSTQYAIDRSSGLLQGIPLETSVDELKASLGNDADSILVYNSSGQPLHLRKCGDRHGGQAGCE